MADEPTPVTGSRLQDVIRRLHEARTRPPKSSETERPTPLMDGTPVGTGQEAPERGELVWRPFRPSEIEVDRPRPSPRPAPSRDEFQSHMSQFLGQHARPSSALFRAQGVSVAFGGVTACAGIDIEANDGEIVALIGPNGAGKTSLCDALSGLIEHDPRRHRLTLGRRNIPVVTGRVYFGEHDLTGLAAHQRAGLGLSRTFQRPALFEPLSVLENLMAARHSQMRGGFFSCGLGLALSKHEERLARAHALEVLDRLEVASLAGAAVSSLPPGLRRTVELARALASDPRLVLMDEPAAGLCPPERRELSDRIAMVCDEMGVAVLVTDQDLPFVATLADYVYVLEAGAVVAKGEPEEMEKDRRVQATYLRGDDAGDLPWPDPPPPPPPPTAEEP